MYLNGSLLYTDPAFSSNYSTYTTRFSIGNFNNGQFSSANVDEVGVWNRVLTSAEVTQLYNSGAGLQYPFGLGANKNQGFFSFFK
jgi:hypothetical protein